MTPQERTVRATIAARRRHRPDDPTTDQLATEFKTDRLAQHILRVVDSAPPLNADQRARLSALLAIGTHVPGVPVLEPIGRAGRPGQGLGRGGS